MAVDSQPAEPNARLRRWRAGAQDAEAARMARVAKALGDPVRLTIVGVLRAGDRSVSDLVRLFGLSQPAISHHLSILRRARLVDARRRGVWTYYSLVDDILADYTRWLATGTSTDRDTPGAQPARGALLAQPGRHPRQALYHSAHTWVRVQGDTAVFGTTTYAQRRWGQAVFVAAAPVGWTVCQHERFAVIESVTTVTDALAPLSGEVVAINRGLADRPERIDQDPYGDGWVLRVRLIDPRERKALLDRDAYVRLLDQLLR